MSFFFQNSVNKNANLKSAKNRAKTQVLQGFPARFASFVTFPENPLSASVFALLFEKWVRLVKSQKSSFLKKSTKNQAKTQAPQGFSAQFASFVTFPVNPLPESVSTSVFEKWVRFVKSQKTSFSKKNTKNKAKTQAPQGFLAHFASFVTFSANPLPESVVGVRFIESDKWVRFVKSQKTSFLKKNAKNQTKTQIPQRFSAYFASFVTFSANPLPASVSAIFLKKVNSRGETLVEVGFWPDFLHFSLFGKRRNVCFKVPYKS